MNPHNSCTALDPPRTRNRRWKCFYCGKIGLFDEMMGPDQSIECPYVYPPCEFCGQTPTCALDCPGIKLALGAPNVAVIGGAKPKIGQG